jgi:hypothetical protein
MHNHIRQSAPRQSEKAPLPDSTSQIDLREQLVNGGEVGKVEQVSLPLEMITKLNGILLDVDCGKFRKVIAPLAVRSNPRQFYLTVLRPILARHAVLSKAEVRVSGTGLHVIVWIDPPVEFQNEPERHHWATIVKVVQRLLPTDHCAPGITATTRPIGSVNSKNNKRVSLLKRGEPISVESILDPVTAVQSAPFRTVAGILFGSEPISPCPVCKTNGSSLGVFDRSGKCYATCGKVHLQQLYESFLRAPSTKKTKG